MADKPIAYTAEVAARLRELVFSLESDVRKMEAAARASLGIAHAVALNHVDIPRDLVAEGALFASGQTVDLAGELRDRYFELFALVVRGVLPEDDEHCQQRRGQRKSLTPNLKASLAGEPTPPAPEAGG
jgi:hypothetical protein